LLFSLLILILFTLVLLVACGGGEVRTYTITNTQNQTSTQTAMITETISQTQTQTQTQTHTQTQTTTLPAVTEIRTITVTILPPTTSTPPVTTTTTTTTTPPPTTTMPPPTNGQPASFSISGLTIEPRIPGEGATIDISVTVTNTGGSQGNYDAILHIDLMNMEDSDNPFIISTETFTKSVVIAAGESTIVTFSKLRLQNGFYITTIDNLDDYVEVGS
ncbi:hypothetical protein ACFLYB_04175, partial [Chloroflexota bacterium]